MVDTATNTITSTIAVADSSPLDLVLALATPWPRPGHGRAVGGTCVTILRSAGRRSQLAWALEDLAALRADAGQPAAARLTLTEALAAYREIGALAEARRAEQRLRARDIDLVTRHRSGRERSVEGWEALTLTELPVARMAGRGLSNPQIADRLGVSARTVQTHVSRVLGKLSATSRVAIAEELARRAEEDG